jgi:biotin carboxyl carrier protein
VNYEVEVNSRLRKVVVHRQEGRFVVAVDGREWVVDAERVDEHTLSLLVARPEGAAGKPGGGLSHEIALAHDALGQLSIYVGASTLTAALNGRRRWGRREGTIQGGSGPQRIIAPMPGKVARVLVKVGDQVAARQPIVVVEAMKMENELRSAHEGTVSEIHAHEGQSVDAGAVLAVIASA